MRVLIIDDNYDLAWCLAQLVRSCGCDAMFAVNPTEGLKLACDFQPEVIFLDIAMPGEDGYALAPRLRTECGLSSVRIIAMSGYQDSPVNREAASIDEHALKPVHLEDLKRLLGSKQTCGA
jgi:CheY-like chemotaxis protein